MPSVRYRNLNNRMFVVKTLVARQAVFSNSDLAFWCLWPEQDKVATSETVFIGNIITFSSMHILQAPENQIWKDAFMEDKTNFLIVDFRS